MVKKEKVEPYTKITRSLAKRSDIGFGGKVLLAYFYGFGGNGCWQTNKQIGEYWGVSPDRIKRRIKRIGKYIYVRNPNSGRRRIWAKSHPAARETVKKWALEHQK